MKTQTRLISVFLTAALLATGTAWGGDKAQRLKKEALTNPEFPDFTSIFNWGLKLKNFKELTFFAGVAAQLPDLTVVAPGDAVGQTDFVLTQLDNFLANNGYSRDDIVRIEFTLTKDVGPDEFNAILGRFVAYFQDVEVKPAAGTLRFVDALAFPDLLVEYEVWAAR